MVLFGGDGVVLNDVLCALGGLGGVLAVLWGCWGLFIWCLVRLEGGDVGIFVVLWRFDVCIGRFRGCWGRSGCFGGVWNVMLGAFYGMFGCVGSIFFLGGCWGIFGGVGRGSLSSLYRVCGCE